LGPKWGGGSITSTEKEKELAGKREERIISYLPCKKEKKKEEQNGKKRQVLAVERQKTLIQTEKKSKQ